MSCLLPKQEDVSINKTEENPHDLRSKVHHIAVIVEDLRLPLDEGAKKAVYHLITSFINRGIEITIFTRYGNPLLKNVFSLPRNKLLCGKLFTYKLRRVAPDINLYIPASSGTIGALIRSHMIKMQSRGVTTAILNLQYRKLPVWLRYFRVYRYADIVFTQSHASEEEFQSLDYHTVLLPGGVDHTLFQPVSLQKKSLLRSQHGYKDTDQIVLHVGHCNRKRNVELLTRLAKEGFQVILIASTSTKQDLPLLEELKQSGVIVISNFVDDVQCYYQMANCYLFPVHNATSAIDTPLSVLEAMACNLPVVTTKFGALPRIFRHGNGFYFADTDEELFEMVRLAVKDRNSSTHNMVAPYSWDNVALTILSAFQEVYKL